MLLTDSYSLNSLVKSYLLSIIQMVNLSEVISADLPWENISLFLTNDCQSWIYKTPVLQQLNISLTVNNSLSLEKISKLFNDYYSGSHLVSEVSHNHWLMIKVGDSILSQWLNEISKIRQVEILRKNDPQVRKKEKQEEVKFIYYNTHARCCSILKSANEQNLIKLNNIEFKYNQWQWEKPELVDYQCLDLYDSYEGKLVRELVRIVDKMEGNKLNYRTTLESLSEGILNVERGCRIWGEVLKKKKNLSLARLGLIAIALKYYQFLIQGLFGQELPSEL